MRRADPTDGFILRLARQNPDVRVDDHIGKSGLTDAGRRWLFELLGIPKRSVFATSAEDDADIR